MKVAAIQMTSGAQLQANMDCAARLIDAAARAGAKLVLLPEYWPLMGMNDQDKVGLANGDDAHKMVEFMQGSAREYGIHLIGGTIPLPTAQPGKVFNTTLVFDPAGQQLARYDKIHLFGFTKDSESYQESQSIVAGNQPVSFQAGTVRVGLSICYDLRFPELYRALAPCDLLVVPAAFTYTTGSVHWEVLLRARAIENQCYVLASGQTGLHQNGRRTWGHSMLIDPWGRIVDELPDGEGFVCGELNLEVEAEVRRNLPALQHRTL